MLHSSCPSLISRQNTETRQTHDLSSLGSSQTIDLQKQSSNIDIDSNQRLALKQERKTERDRDKERRRKDSETFWLELNNSLRKEFLTKTLLKCSSQN